ncbi:MAG: FHA domain-containing protein [Bdellovibrionales bacterium]|nr:FHA domain-containing protein [Bdellovibrionales bacterium]
MESKQQNLAGSGIRLDVLGKDGVVIHTGEFIKDKIVMGRILSADLRIDDPRVSRIHALIEIRNEEIILTDLASSHGTFLNSKKVVESKLKFGDIIRLGFVELKVTKGSGQASAPTASKFDAEDVTNNDATLVDIERDEFDTNRRDKDRRKKDAFPTEKRLEERRQGDRRIEQRKEDRRKEGTSEADKVISERREDDDRRKDLPRERRGGERRQSERRVFDITSLERRIDDRRDRKSDDDILPEELEKAFESPSHAREIEVTALWGDHILDISNYNNECVLNIGESPRNDYIIPSVGIPDEFPLLTIQEDGTSQLAFTEEMSGTIRARDKIYSIKDLRNEKFVRKEGDHYVMGLKQDDFAKIAVGTVSFFILYVKPAPRILRPPFFEQDALLMRTTVGSVLLFLALMIGLSFVPKPIPVTIEQVPERFAKIVIKKRPDISKMGLIAKGEESKEGGSVAGEGGPAIGPEGEAGRKDLPRKEEKAQTILPKSKPKANTTPSPVATKTATPAKTKVPEKKSIKSVGLLKAMSNGAIQKEFNNLINAGEGPEGPGGFDEFGKAIRGARGKSLEETGGAGGMGLKGVDAGGGGKTVGIDGPSTKGLGRGYHGDGIGEGISGPGRFGLKGEHAISIVSENIQVLSGLSKDLINAVVQRHRAEIRACYDSALQRNPKLSGKVVMFFNIQSNGIVSTVGIKESTIGDAGLESCIGSRIKSWVFPKPEAPVVTEVAAYPFYLNPAN